MGRRWGRYCGVECGIIYSTLSALEWGGDEVNWSTGVQWEIAILCGFRVAIIKKRCKGG